MRAKSRRTGSQSAIRELNRGLDRIAGALSSLLLGVLIEGSALIRPVSS
jgi:hypothetical protein